MANLRLTEKQTLHVLRAIHVYEQNEELNPTEKYALDRTKLKIREYLNKELKLK